MVAKELGPGDRVVYVDSDEIEWGPWEVIDREGESVTVRVEDTILYEISAEALRRKSLGAESNTN